LCAKCGLDYNLIHHRPAVLNTCDVCGGRLEARPDDNEVAVKKRLADYHEKTEPVLDLFRNKELVITADGREAPEAVQSKIRRELRLTG
jgi:adenylate kinase